jgi:GTP-binding protein
VRAPPKRRGKLLASVKPSSDTKATNETRIATAEFAAAAAKPDQIPAPSEPEIAFAGRSNVGKSSLLNMLLARKSLARTSNTPGRTRQINFFDVAVAGGPKMAFVDLPGYGYAKVSKSESASWKALLESYLQERPTLRAVILLIDVRRGLEQEERDLLEFLALRKDVGVVIAATKTDKVSRNALKPLLSGLAKEAGVRVVGTSAETRAGREELWSRILEKVV